MVWGDFNNDGRLDILSIVNDGSQQNALKLYQNDGNGVFHEVLTGLPTAYHYSASWGDYDNDGRLDILVTGCEPGGSGKTPFANIYHNDGNGVFHDISAGLAIAGRGAASWGDYDNDGRLDILVVGTEFHELSASIYHNDGNGVFRDIAAQLPGLGCGNAQWADYDNDGRLDIVGTAGDQVWNGCSPPSYAPRIKVYHNDGNGSFQAIAVGPEGMRLTSGGCADINGDGRLDFLAYDEYARTVHFFSNTLAPIVPFEPATIGLYTPDDSAFYLRNSNDTGFADSAFGYGPADSGWTALSGDWNGDGVDTIGLFDPTTSTFYLRNSNDAGFAGVTFSYGPANSGWIAIAGDWNGDGVDTVGLYDSKASVFYLRDTNTTGIADTTFAYGPAHNDSYGRSTTWTPIAGDWDGDGRDTIALYDPTQSVFYLRNSNDSGFADVTFCYGTPNGGWTPIAGDWNGDAQGTVGLYAADSSVFYLANANQSGYADVTFAYGPAGAGWTPVVGDWGNTDHLLKAAAGDATSAQDVQSLPHSSLAPTVQAAIARWADAGLGSAAIERLSQVQFVVADLPGDCLGKAEGNTVYIDANAAGHGWFIDPTPANDEEFTVSSDGALQAIDARALDQIDLVTVVEHELGHIAGFADLDATIDNVMAAVLPVGLRRAV
jgi:hypothetical protein